MKTQKEIETLLEKQIKAIDEVAAAIPKGKKASPEQESMIAALLGGILSLGVVLDCEEEMKPMLRIFKMEALAQKLASIQP